VPYQNFVAIPAPMAHEVAESDYDARRQREIDVQTVEQGDENRDDLPKQQDDHRRRNAEYGNGINHGRLHGPFQLDVLFDVARQALENGIENTARLAGFHHVVIERIENLLVLLHRSGQRGAALDRSTHSGEDLLEGLVLLLARENLEALHEGQARVDHHGELAGEDGQLLRFDARAKSGDIELLPLLGELADIDALAAQHGREFALARRGSFSRDRGARPVGPAICKYRHNLLPPS
jgi:hypothetical protein